MISVVQELLMWDVIGLTCLYILDRILRVSTILQEGGSRAWWFCIHSIGNAVANHTKKVDFGTNLIRFGCNSVFVC